MARRTRTPATYEVKRTTLIVPRVEAEKRISAQIEKGKQLLQWEIADHNGLEVAKAEQRKWSDYNADLLRRIVDTDEFVDNYIPSVAFASWGPSSLNERVERFHSETKDRIVRLESIVARLELIPEPPEISSSPQSSSAKSREMSDRVFIVHGHDEEAKQSVARCIEHLGPEAIILHEQANQGRTIIEKFEDYTDVGFAVVLLTPDDVGAIKSDPTNLKPRARQNVIFELGFFIGRLGRKRVCALHKGNTEIPSDFSGILWVTMDPNSGWRLTLGREMKAAGLEVDLNRLT